MATVDSAKALPRRVVTLVAGAVTTVLAASFVIFVALSLAPGDPVARLLGQRATEAERAATRQRLGLDDPILERYWHWLTGAVRGDFGTSLTYRGEAVTSLLAPRIATTMTLVGMALVLTVVVGIALGTLGGVSRRWRSTVSAVTGLGVAIPGFVAAMLLIGVFAVGLGWFPTFGAGTGLADRLWHLTLPAVALAVGYVAYLAQMTAATVRAESESDHVTTAIGRGIGRARVIRRHVLRNAALPVMTVSGLIVAGLVAGSVVVESAFGVDGLGSLLVRSVLGKDYPVVSAVCLLIAVVFVVVMTLVDALHAAFDPRLREAR